MTGTTKYGFYLQPEVSEMIDRHLEIADARSRSEFVDRAVKELCCALDSNSNRDVLSYEVTRMIKAAVKDSENCLCNYLFKMAGEMGLLTYLVGADLINMTDEEIKACRYKAFDEVRRQRGVLNLEDVVRKEKAIADGKYNW